MIDGASCQGKTMTRTLQTLPSSHPHLPPGTLKIPKYTVFNPAKTQNLLWKASQPAYQLVDPDGHIYVLQGHKVLQESLATLAERFQRLPDGWKYRAGLGRRSGDEPDAELADTLRAGRVSPDLYSDS